MDLIELSSNNSKRHPWELSRTENILKITDKFHFEGKILDIGCGDSFFDKQLIKNNPRIDEVWGIDIFLTDDDLGDEKLKTVNSLDKLKLEKFDFIIMMDVLEHIENDEEYLFALKDRLKPDGKILITVPAFQKLYSLHDKELHHFRRYNFKRLHTAIMKSGYRVVDWHYFYCILLFGRLITMNKTENLGMWTKDSECFQTRLVKTILNLDFAICSILHNVGCYIGGLSLYMMISLK